MKNYKVKNQALVDKLNAIDKVRENLTGFAGDDQGFLNMILETLPQFVVVGAQSAGKSSVLKRISNNSIKLPEAANVCTKVPTLLILRRGKPMPTEVTVKGPSGFNEEIEVEDSSPEAVCEAVKQGQDVAMQQNPEKIFAEDYCVEVKITNEEMPNVTLIDLPGFTNASDDATRIVNEMVEKYVNMSGSLVLHVCKSDQDYDTILGNDFLRKIGKDKILVLTHTDRLNSLKPNEYVERLDATVKSTNEPRFAVIGNHDGSFEEENQLLNQQPCISKRVDILKGTAALNTLIEKKISQHLDSQLPKAIDSIYAEFDKTKHRLEIIKECDPTTVIYMIISDIHAKMKESSSSVEKYLRQSQEYYSNQLKNLTIYDLVPKNRYVQISSSNLYLCIKGLLLFYENKLKYKLDKEITSNDIKYNNELHDDYCINDFRIDYGPIDEIIILSEDRTLSNIALQDKSIILSKFAETYAERYTRINQSNLRATYKLLLEHFKSCFSVETRSSADIAVKKLLKIFEHEYAKNYEEAEKAVLHLKEWNMKPFCFAIDENALAAHRLNCGAIDYNSATAELTAFTIQLEIEAYLKVQADAIVEASFKMISILLYKRGQETLERILKENMTSVISYVEDPEEIKNERILMSKRKDILEECVKLLGNI